jgi:fumarylacetoacetate (FAA) hydrolase
VGRLRQFLEEPALKLASLKAGGRDGTLLVVSRDLKRAAPAQAAPTLQAALDDWSTIATVLEGEYHALNVGLVEGAPLDMRALAAPLPRAYQWLDGSAYLTHVKRMRMARGAEMPPDFLTDPLMYQGLSDQFLGPREPMCVEDEAWGLDFEGEVAAITDDVPRGCGATAAAAHIKLLLLVNDTSLRKLIPTELAKGFGFLHGKPACAASPVAVTPDELGAAWDGAKLHGRLVIELNGKRFGDPDAGADMQFGFPALIAHAAKTRRLGAGTIIGAGTVSNAEIERGCACLVEQQVLEILDGGKAQTPFLRYGDRVRMQLLDAEGRSVFGAIEQEVKPCR